MKNVGEGTNAVKNSDYFDSMQCSLHDVNQGKARMH